MRTPGPVGGAYSRKIGKRIRWLRAIQDLTLVDIQKRCGIQAKTLARYECGGLSIPSNAIERLAGALNICPMRLCGPVDDFSRLVYEQVGAIEALTVFVRILNEAYEADPSAIHSLINLRVPCNKTLADHPTVQVASESEAMAECFFVGLIGIINGICEPLTGKRVAAKFSAPDPQTKHSKLLGFTEYLSDSPQTTGPAGTAK